MKTTKFKLQFAVVGLSDVLIDEIHNRDSCHNTIPEDVDYLEWFDKEDEAIFNFAKTYSSWEKFPNNMVIKRVVKI